MTREIARRRSERIRSKHQWTAPGKAAPVRHQPIQIWPRESSAKVQEEQGRGFEFLRDPDEAQGVKAVLAFSKAGKNNLAEAFNGNLVLDYAGIPADGLRSTQQQRLMDLIELFISNMDEGHARVKMDEVRRYSNNTTFAWIGGVNEGGVFYYRIYSPVILIVEFDHQSPGASRFMGEDPKKPTRQHIHVVVPTPNGNDYGKDLLRQHHLSHPH